MGFEINKLYYTKTMINILRRQGHVHLAVDLTEKILAEKPDQPEIQAVHQSLKEELKRSFEKFVKAGQSVLVVTPLARKIEFLQSLLTRVQEKRAVVGG